MQQIEGLFSSDHCPNFSTCEFAENDCWYITFDSEENTQKAWPSTSLPLSLSFSLPPWCIRSPLPLCLTPPPCVVVLLLFLPLPPWSSLYLSPSPPLSFLYPCLTLPLFLCLSKLYPNYYSPSLPLLVQTVSKPLFSLSSSACPIHPHGHNNCVIPRTNKCFTSSYIM